MRVAVVADSRNFTMTLPATYGAPGAPVLSGMASTARTERRRSSSGLPGVSVLSGLMPRSIGGGANWPRAIRTAPGTDCPCPRVLNRVERARIATPQAGQRRPDLDGNIDLFYRSPFTCLRRPTRRLA